MKKFTTSDRLKFIMEDRNLKQVDIIRKAEPFCRKYDVRLGKNDLSQYVSGKIEPGQDKLTILGLALNVSEAWLMGFEVPMNRDTPATYEGDERMTKLVELAACLSPEEQEEIISMIEWKLSRK